MEGEQALARKLNEAEEHGISNNGGKEHECIFRQLRDTVPILYKGEEAVLVHRLELRINNGAHTGRAKKGDILHKNASFRAIMWYRSKN